MCISGERVSGISEYNASGSESSNIIVYSFSGFSPTSI